MHASLLYDYAACKHSGSNKINTFMSHDHKYYDYFVKTFGTFILYNMNMYARLTLFKYTIPLNDIIIMVS